MVALTPFFRLQFAAYCKGVKRFRQLKRRKRAACGHTGHATRCRNVEDAIELGLLILGKLQAVTRDWGEALSSNPKDYPWEEARKFARKYQLWLNAARTILTELESCESRHGPVKRAEEFREAVRQVALMPLDMESVRAATEQLERGEGISLEAAMDVLHR